MIDTEDRMPIAVGIDIGTSGTRAVALNSQGDVTATAACAFATADENRNPLAWWAGARTCLEQLGGLCDLRAVEGIAVDGTSGTLLAVDRQYRPIGHASLYNDTCGDTSILQAVEDLAPAESPSRGAISPAARAIMLARTQGTYKILHQADWVAFQLAHRSAAVSDENNALKTGYDLQNECWPEWLEKAGLDLELLPEVLRAGVAHAFVGARAVGLGFSDQCRVHAGTTDGCASFLATGAGEVGDGVTALGSTLVLKLASDCAISAPQYGIYSHRIGDIWLVGGASNTGGGVIRALFGDERLAALSRQLDPSRPTGLDYYPLLKPGSAFP
nr:FGGY family carbohydrate kinase [Marinicella sp. W31]MDC2880240.1 FGGY family carbohydrate kinase [Marinicella sp. W31]